MGRAAFESRDARLHHVRGRVEVGLADLEVDDAPALGLERTRTYEDLERGLGSEPREPLRELHRAPFGAGSAASESSRSTP